MKEIPESFDSRHYRQTKHGKTYWAFSLGLLLFMMLSLILLTNLNNFVLNSQTRNLLLEMKVAHNQDIPVNDESTTIRNELPTTTQTSPEITSEKTTKFSSQTLTYSSESTINLTIIPPYTTSEDTETTELASSSTTRDASSSIESISTNSSTSTTEPVEKRNPIVLLNEINHLKKNYTCIKTCNEPSIITAQLNLSLSTSSDNFLLLTTQVMTNEARVAKRKVAYLALHYLYKEYLPEALTDTEWDLSISPCRNQSHINTQISC